MGDPGIDPSDCVDGIRTIRGNPVVNEEILMNRLIHPFCKSLLFFSRPSAVADFPDLIRGFIQRLAEARWGAKDHYRDSEDKEKHSPMFTRIAEDCQQKLEGARP
jgi:hypothetical protein